MLLFKSNERYIFMIISWIVHKKIEINKENSNYSRTTE